MSQIAQIVGKRIPNFRLQHGWNQETLAEFADLDSTYIGQVERGEKNATIESLEKFLLLYKYRLLNYLKNLAENRHNYQKITRY